MKILTEEQFEEQFTLVDNPIDDLGHNGKLFEWDYSNDSNNDILRNAQKDFKLLSLIEGDYDSMYIVRGMSVVNRIGFFITNEEVYDDIQVEYFPPMSAENQLKMVEEYIGKANVIAKAMELEDGYQQIELTTLKGDKIFIREDDDTSLNDMHDELCEVLDHLCR